MDGDFNDTDAHGCTEDAILSGDDKIHVRQRRLSGLFRYGYRFRKAYHPYSSKYYGIKKRFRQNSCGKPILYTMQG